jgi:transcription factor STE12
MMYSQHQATMAPPQKPETFMLSNEAQQSLPQDAQVALQQVDNCALLNTTLCFVC